MANVYCLDCDSKIMLDQRTRVNSELMCPHCEAEFQIVSLDPPEIVWSYEDWDDGDSDDYNTDYDSNFNEYE